MALSRSSKIIFLLVLDIVFFFVEIIVGPCFSHVPPACVIRAPSTVTDVIYLSCVYRVCRWLTGPCCGCLPHAQVNAFPALLDPELPLPIIPRFDVLTTPFSYLAML